jgi:hypothetical protein
VVCVLQSLLTNCTELLSGMRKNQKPFFKDLLSDAPHEWGLRRSFVEQDTFPIDLPLERVLEHLRNAFKSPNGARKRQLSLHRIHDKRRIQKSEF